MRRIAIGSFIVGLFVALVLLGRGLPGNDAQAVVGVPDPSGTAGNEDAAGPNTCDDGIDNGPDGTADWDGDVNPPGAGPEDLPPDLDCHIINNVLIDMDPFNEALYDHVALENGVNSCGDGIDNGPDGSADAADGDCTKFGPYMPALPEDNVSGTCDDGLDQFDFLDNQLYDGSQTDGMIDGADPSCNPTQNPPNDLLGSVETCKRVEVDSTIQIDLIVDEVDPSDAMNGYNINLGYEDTVAAPGQVSVTAVNDIQMIGAGDGSIPLTLSDGPLPDLVSPFNSGATDTGPAGLPASEAGEGVLARVTIKGLVQGLSTLTIQGPPVLPASKVTSPPLLVLLPRWLTPPTFNTTCTP